MTITRVHCYYDAKITYIVILLLHITTIVVYPCHVNMQRERKTVSREFSTLTVIKAPSAHRVAFITIYTRTQRTGSP